MKNLIVLFWILQYWNRIFFLFPEKECGVAHDIYMKTNYESDTRQWDEVEREINLGALFMLN